ncbi:MAG: RHS repeat-associated core domain-containing protein, partial [Thermoplasmata archaeon]
RFLGQYYDSESGLNYNLHRYYWAEIGRYISPDKWNIATANLPMQNWPREAFYIYGKTIKKALMLDRGKIIEEILDSLHPYNYFLDDPLNQNLYNYVKSNPLIFTDPYGLFKCDTYRLVECFFHLLGSIGEGMGLALVRCAFTPNPVCCYVGLGIPFAPAVIATTHGCINRYCKKEPCIKQKCQ